MTDIRIELGFDYSDDKQFVIPSGPMGYMPKGVALADLARSSGEVMKMSVSSYCSVWVVAMDNGFDLSAKGGYAIPGSHGYARVTPTFGIVNFAPLPILAKMEMSISVPTSVNKLYPILVGVRLAGKRFGIVIFSREGVQEVWSRQIKAGKLGNYTKDQFIKQVYSGDVSNGEFYAGKHRIPFPAFAIWTQRNYGMDVGAPDGTPPLAYNTADVFCRVELGTDRLIGFMYLDESPTFAGPAVFGRTFPTPVTVDKSGKIQGFSDPDNSVLHHPGMAHTAFTTKHTSMSNVNYAVAAMYSEAQNEGWITPPGMQPPLLPTHPIAAVIQAIGMATGNATNPPQAYPSRRGKRGGNNTRRGAKGQDRDGGGLQNMLPLLNQLMHNPSFRPIEFKWPAELQEKGMGIPEPPDGYQWFATIRGMPLLTNGQEVFWPHEVFDPDAIERVHKKRGTQYRDYNREEALALKAMFEYLEKLGASIQNNAHIFGSVISAEEIK